MRAAAEVDELAGGVERDDGLDGFFLDELAFENLIGIFVKLESFGLGHELALVGQILRRELVHLGFDFGEVVGSKGLIAKKFVEKAGVDGRTYAELDVWIQLHNRSGEKMRGGMAKDEKGVGIFFGEDLELDVVVERAAQVDEFTGTVIGGGYTGDERGICQARGNSLGDVRGRGALGHFLDFAVRQCDVNRVHV